MKRSVLIVLFALSIFAATGCGDDDDGGGNGPTDTGVDAVTDTGGDIGRDAGADADTGLDAADGGDTGVQSTMFTVRVQNTSAATAFPLPLSPGVWAIHSGDNPIFTAGQPDPGDGLEALAEDGKPADLADSLSTDDSVASAAAFSTDGPLAPGDAVSFEVEATPDAGQLSLATMFIPSNDVFLAPGADGIDLFDAQGAPIDERVVTDDLMWWNAGTERDEAPDQGPNQVQRQQDSAVGPGPAEGVVARFDNTTRALPEASSIVDVSVTESAGTFTVAIQNVSADQAAIVTPISPVVWASHEPDFNLFDLGSSASDGLEAVAEDGAPSVLVSELADEDDVSASGVANTPEGAGSPGPLMPGDTYQFEVTADESSSAFSLATMVVQSNDAFLGFKGPGVLLLDDSGDPRPTADIEADIERTLAVFDAGTEANEVPGVGANQKPRQPRNDVGPDDPDDQIRLYADSTNDLGGPSLGGVVDVTVTPAGAGMFDVKVTNTSGDTAYPAVLTPVAWALHSSAAQLFTVGQSASDGLETLAEDGDASGLSGELDANGDVASSGVAKMAEGASQAGPLMPGDSYSFRVSVDADHPQLSLASMVVPSNDTFLSFAPEGIALVDADGNARSADDIAADIADSLHAWDAGTEANQAGAAGPDQAPRQSGPNTGPAVGDGTVRLNDDSVWSYPSVAQSVRVTITPVIP